MMYDQRIKGVADRRHAGAGGLVGAVVLACALALGACSSNGDKKATKPEADKKAEAPGADKPYPNLASVPDKQPKTSTARQRMKIQEGLLADRANARHVDGPVAGRNSQTASVTTLPPQTVKREVITPPTADEVRRRTFAARRQTAINRALKKIGNPLRVQRGGYLATVRFPPDSSALPTGSGKVIVQVSQLHRIAGGRIRVVGRGANSAAAAAKAKAVANGLVQLGVSPDRIGLVARNGRGAAKKSQADIYYVGPQ